MSLKYRKGQVISLWENDVQCVPCSGVVAKSTLFHAFHQPHSSSHSSVLDPCCSYCHRFLRRSFDDCTYDKCCSSAVYCSESDCAAKHQASSHWLTCSSSRLGKLSRSFKDFMHYAAGSKECSALMFSCDVLGRLISEAAPSGDLQHSLRGFFACYPLISMTANNDDSECIEVTQESYSLLCAMLLNDRLADRLPASSVQASFTLDAWQRILAIVDSFSVSIFLESPYLHQLQRLPLLRGCGPRQQAVQRFADEAEQAAVFLTGVSQRLAPGATAEEVLLHEDRALNLLSQAAGAVSAGNPFEACGLQVLVLPAGLFPMQLGGSAVLHACCANVNLEARKDAEGLGGLQLVALSDIYPEESLRFDFGKGLFGFGRSCGYAIADCACSVCSLRASLPSFLQQRMPRRSACVGEGMDLEEVTRRLCADLHALANASMGKLSSMQHAIDTNPALSSRLRGCGKAMRELRAAADHEAANKGYAAAAVVYMAVLVEVLSCITSTDSSPSNERDELEDGTAVALWMTWSAEVCVSLGTVIFESLLASAATPLGHRDMEIVYQIGHWLCPADARLSEQVAKLLAYRVEAPPSLPVIPFDRYEEGIFGTNLPEIGLKDCDWVVAQAEAYAERMGGWSTGRHYSVPTTDIPLHRLPDPVGRWFADLMTNKARALISQSFFDGEAIQMVVNDAFVVKYQADDSGTPEELASTELHQRSLPLHADQSTLSFTIALNDLSDYAGGGTYFAQFRRTCRPAKGHMVCFRGSHLHGGDCVLRGTRYIIAAFLLVTPSSIEPPAKRLRLDEPKSSSSFSFNFDCT